jgi:hypothetical protein
VSTARSSTDPAFDALRAIRDVGSLMRFRMAGLRGRARLAAPIALAVIGAITVAAATVPAFIAEQQPTRRDMMLLLPSAYLAVLVVSIVSTATSGGGRELLPREQAGAFPVSTTTDHLGALVMAPLNIAWLLQCWVVLGATSYAIGARPGLVLALVAVLVWFAAAAAVAQTIAWAIEWVRRGRHGRHVVRAGALLLAATLGTLIATGTLTSLLDSSPTLRIAIGVVAGADGHVGPWARMTAVLVVVAVVATALGASLARRVARRPSRDELRAEASHRAMKPNPASDLAALMRTDRAGIWRSVPMRRGMVVLALLPGLAALSGSFQWETLGIFPGLVASGGALLFGVNSWCLDARGALWRDSLPANPRLVFGSRALVLLEILFASIALTLVIASVRAGVPSSSELAAVLCATVVVTVQVVATALSWSVSHPYAVDLRSARATPAPPLVMVGYSARLALATTFTGLLFDLLTHAPWTLTGLCALPFLVWSLLKLDRTAAAWSDPVTRARVVATVAS